jgi:hypothetical protein
LENRHRADVNLMGAIGALRSARELVELDRLAQALRGLCDTQRDLAVRPKHLRSRQRTALQQALTGIYDEIEHARVVLGDDAADEMQSRVALAVDTLQLYNEALALHQDSIPEGSSDIADHGPAFDRLLIERKAQLRHQLDALVRAYKDELEMQ